MVTLLNRARFFWTPGLGENNVLNDCAVVALVNAARAASMVQRGFDLAINWDAVVAWFAKIANVDPTLPAEETVKGLDPQAVIDFAIRHGIQAGLQAPIMLRRGTPLRPPTPEALFEAMKPGAAYVELGLCANDLTSAECMDEFIGLVVARHQAFFWDCSGLGATDTAQFGTWGRWQYMTWRGAQARVELAWDLDWILP